MDALDNKPLNDQFYLGRKKNLSEIAAAGVVAQKTAVENLGLGQVRLRSDGGFEILSGAEWIDAASEYRGLTGFTKATRLIVRDDVLSFSQAAGGNFQVGATTTFTSGVFEHNETTADFFSRVIKDVRVGNTSNTPTDANFVAPIAWKGRDIMLDLTNLTADRTITFDSADGWTDGDWVNIWVTAPVSNTNAIVYTGAGTLTAANDESKLKQTNGAVSVKIDGTVARVVGKLKA